jgi:hypothetical protein
MKLALLLWFTSLLMPTGPVIPTIPYPRSKKAKVICVGWTSRWCDYTYPSTSKGLREALALPTRGLAEVYLRPRLEYYPESSIIVSGLKSVYGNGVQVHLTDQFSGWAMIIVNP